MPFFFGFSFCSATTVIDRFSRTFNIRNDSSVG